MTDLVENRVLSVSEFFRMKVVQYSDIPIVKNMECPECHQSAVPGSSIIQKLANMIGWCDTEGGLMAVFMCPLCFEKFRCHINFGERWYLQGFYDDFTIKYHLYKKEQHDTGTIHKGC